MKADRIILLVVTSFFLFVKADCGKRGKECHSEIIINNNSNYDIICASKWISGGTANCQLIGPALKQGENHKLVLGRSCWENELYNGKTEDVYIIDPSHYNNQGFYSCDSIEVKNTILKHYVLTLDDLKKTNFIVNYP